MLQDLVFSQFPSILYHFHFNNHHFYFSTGSDHQIKMTESIAEDNSKSNTSPAVGMTSSLEVADNKELSIDKGDNQLKSWPYMTFGTLIKSLLTKAISFGLIWGVGYMNWNFAWLIPPIAFVVLRGERKKDAQMKRLTAQATALSKDKIIIENRIDELPIWVYFPDYDRAEWLNGVRISIDLWF